MDAKATLPEISIIFGQVSVQTDFDVRWFSRPEECKTFVLAS